MSWIVRDACRLYLDAMETDPAAMACLRPVVPVLDMKEAGGTVQDKRGRPRKNPATAA